MASRDLQRRLNKLEKRSLAEKRRRDQETARREREAKEHFRTRMAMCRTVLARNAELAQLVLRSAPQFAQIVRSRPWRQLITIVAARVDDDAPEIHLPALRIDWTRGGSVDPIGPTGGVSWNHLVWVLGRGTKLLRRFGAKQWKQQEVHARFRSFREMAAPAKGLRRRTVASDASDIGPSRSQQLSAVEDVAVLALAVRQLVGWVERGELIELAVRVLESDPWTV